MVEVGRNSPNEGGLMVKKCGGRISAMGAQRMGHKRRVNAERHRSRSVTMMMDDDVVR